MKRRSKSSIQLKRLRKKILLNIKKHKIMLTIILVVLVFFSWVKIMYSKYINNKENKISAVYFHKHILENLQLRDLVKDSESAFSGTNSVKDNILDFKEQKEFIKNKYKFLSNVWADIINNNTLQISFSFKKPELEFIWSGTVHAAYSEDNIKKFYTENISWLNLNLSWTNKLRLPRYLHWENMKLIFYKNSLKKIQKYTTRIKKTFPESNLYYLAWAENIKVQTKNQELFFSMNKDIDKQLSQYSLLKQKMSEKFKNARIIDLWNLDEWVYLKEIWIWK